MLGEVADFPANNFVVKARLSYLTGEIMIVFGQCLNPCSRTEGPEEIFLVGSLEIAVRDHQREQRGPTHEQLERAQED